MKKTIALFCLIILPGCSSIKPIERQIAYNKALNQDIPSMKVDINVEDSHVNGFQSSVLLKERLDSIFISALKQSGKYSDDGDQLILEVGYILTSEGDKIKPIVWTTVEKFDLNTKQAIPLLGNYFDRQYKFHFTIKVKATIRRNSEVKWSKDYVLNEIYTKQMSEDGFVDGISVSLVRIRILDQLYKESLQKFTQRIFEDIAKEKL